MEHLRKISKFPSSKMTFLMSKMRIHMKSLSDQTYVDSIKNYLQNFTHCSTVTSNRLLESENPKISNKQQNICYKSPNENVSKKSPNFQILIPPNINNILGTSNKFGILIECDKIQQAIKSALTKFVQDANGSNNGGFSGSNGASNDSPSGDFRDDSTQTSTSTETSTDTETREMSTQTDFPENPNGGDQHSSDNDNDKRDSDTKTDTEHIEHRKVVDHYETHRYWGSSPYDSMGFPVGPGYRGPGYYPHGYQGAYGGWGGEGYGGYGGGGGSFVSMLIAAIMMGAMGFMAYRNTRGNPRGPPDDGRRRR